MNSWPAYHGLKPSTTEDPPCRGTMRVKSVERSNVFPWMWYGVVVRRGWCQLRCHPRHLTMVQNAEVPLDEDDLIEFRTVYDTKEVENDVVEERALEFQRNLKFCSARYQEKELHKQLERNKKTAASNRLCNNQINQQAVNKERNSSFKSKSTVPDTSTDGSSS
ncbi:hypothetical protein TNCV_2858671 [Trichonephila clavipes]|nr:hypothetical protein TNCV_2858671 [Trichonephila clavipes]